MFAMLADITNENQAAPYSRHLTSSRSGRKLTVKRKLLSPPSLRGWGARLPPGSLCFL
jgi:hypothetical protein